MVSKFSNLLFYHTLYYAFVYSLCITLKHYVLVSVYVLAQFGGAAGLIGMIFVGSNTTAAVILMTVTVATNSGHYCGFLSNHLDLSPNFAGVLMGITNCISNTFSFLAPLTAGFILKDEVK